MSNIASLPHLLDDGSRLYTKNAARSLWLTDDQYYTGGNALATPDWALGWNTAQTVDGLYLGLLDGQNTLVIGEYGDRAYDFAHGAQTHPTLYLQSANQSATEFARLNAGAHAFGLGIAVVSTEYSIGRDADGTNQLHLNVPTGATFEFSINDVVEMTLSAAAVNFQNNTITTTGGGSLTGTWSNLGTVTTIDINGGTLDGVVVGGVAAAAGTFTTLTATSIVIGANTITTAEWANLDGLDQTIATTSSPTFVNLTITSFAANWTNAGRTVADLGIVTTVDINGGTVDGVTIGGTTAGAITGTTITVNTNLVPDANDGAGLGISGTAFSDLFLAPGAVINFAASNYTITHATAALTFTQAAATTGSPTALTIIGGAHTTLAAGTEAVDVNFNLDRIVQFATGALASQRAVVFDAPTYAFVGASTLTAAAGVSVASMPLAGANATITTTVGFSAAALGGHLSNAGSAFWIATEIPGIALGMGATTARIALTITGPDGGSSNLSLGDQTATLTQLISLNVSAVSVTSTVNTRTVTSAIGAIFNAPTAATAQVEFGTLTGVLIGTTNTMYASTASSSFYGLNIDAGPLTLGKTTQLTSVTPAVAGAYIEQITVAQSAGATIVDNVASLYIAGALIAGGSVTLTNNYAVWVDAGVSRMDGGVIFGLAGAGTNTVLNQYVEATFTPTVTLVGGAGNTVPVYTTNTGRYTRVGNRVYVDVYLTGDGGAEGAGTGQINIALPVTANASNPAGVFGVGYMINSTNERALLGEIVGGATTIALSYWNTDTATLTFTGALQNNVTRTIRIQFFYDV